MLEQKPFLLNWPKCRLDRNYLIWLVLAKLRVVKRLRNVNVLNVLRQLMKHKQTLSCVCFFLIMLLTVYGAIYYLIEHFDYVLVSSQITAVILSTSEKEYG